MKLAILITLIGATIMLGSWVQWCALRDAYGPDRAGWPKQCRELACQAIGGLILGALFAVVIFLS